MNSSRVVFLLQFLILYGCEARLLLDIGNISCAIETNRSLLEYSPFHLVFLAIYLFVLNFRSFLRFFIGNE